MHRFTTLACIAILAAACASAQSQKGPERLLVIPGDQVISPSGSIQFHAILSSFRAQGQPSGEKDITSGVQWSASPTGVVNIDSSGHAMATGVAGPVTITARSGPFEVSVPLTVSNATLNSVSISPASPSIPAGFATQLHAIGAYSDSSTHDLTTGCSWTSATPANATVNQNLGTLQALKQGTSLITATCSGVSGSTTATVAAPVLEILNISPANGWAATGTTQQFTATGIFSDGSVQDVTAGTSWGTSNGAAATISSTGLATSVAVGTTVITAQFSGQTASVPFAAVYPGTTESVSAFVSASAGSTVELPDGTTASIAPGALNSDQYVSFSLMPALPQQPPSGLVVGVGPAVYLTTAAMTFSTNTGALQFSINAGTNNQGLQGSAAISDVVDSNGHNFLGIIGSYNAKANVANSIMDASLVNGSKIVLVSMGNLAPQFLAVRASLAEVLAGTAPPSPGQRTWNGSAWVPYAGCPAGPKVLLMVHGMNSSVEDAFSCAGSIQSAGGYDGVVGLDYNWTNDISSTSGASVAFFLNSLAQNCPNIKQIDVEAHSEGGPVAASGLLQVSAKAHSLITNFIALGSPWNGTLAAYPAVTLQGFSPLLTVLENLQATSLVLNQNLQNVLNGTWAIELLPGSSLLSSIGQNLPTAAQNILVAGGNAPNFPIRVLQDLVLAGLNPTNDNVVPTGSALAQGLNWRNATRLPAYSLSHTQLECNQQVINDVGAWVHNNGPGLTGLWSGSWAWSGTGSNGCTFSDGGTFSMNLTQSGTSFSGSVTAAGVETRDNATCAVTSVDTVNGTISGSISGNTLNFSMSLFGSQATLNFTGTGTVNQNTISATIQRDTGGTGSINTTKQ